MQNAATQAQPVPAARFCLAIEEQRSLIFETSNDVSFRLARMKFMARLAIYMCAQIIREAVDMAEGEIERVMTACDVISKSLAGGAAHA